MPRAPRWRRGRRDNAAGTGMTPWVPWWHSSPDLHHTTCPMANSSLITNMRIACQISDKILFFFFGLVVLCVCFVLTDAWRTPLPASVQLSLSAWRMPSTANTTPCGSFPACTALSGSSPARVLALGQHRDVLFVWGVLPIQDQVRPIAHSMFRSRTWEESGPWDSVAWAGSGQRIVQVRISNLNPQADQEECVWFPVLSFYFISKQRLKRFAFCTWKSIVWDEMCYVEHDFFEILIFLYCWKGKIQWSV